MRARRVAVRLVLGLTGTLAALLALEAFLHVVDPGGYAELEERERFSGEILTRGGDGVLRLRPGATSTYLGHPVVIGPHGLRNQPVAVPKPADAFRIVVLGDSVPFGWGVAEDAAFPRLVEAALARTPRSDGRRYEVVNAGIPGFGLVEEYLWLRDHGLAFAPDVVLHCVIHNDVEPQPRVPPLVLSATLRNVRALRLLERLADQVGSKRGVEPGSGLTPEQLAFGLDRCVELCASKGVRYVYMDTVGVAQAVEHCAAKGIARIDCVVTQAWVDEHRVRPSDFHPNAAGHRWFAERVVDQLPPLLAR